MGRAANSRILREINAKKDASGSDAQGAAFLLGWGRKKKWRGSWHGTSLKESSVSKRLTACPVCSN
jgi:hypothetical protein